MHGAHLICKQRFDLRLTQHDAVPEIQAQISRLCSEHLTPALERLFDRLAGPDQLVRLGKIELELGMVSSRELSSEVFTQKVIVLLEGAIAEASARSPRDTIMQPLRRGRFESWLCFLENGYLPPYAGVPASPEEWHGQVLEALGADLKALQRLRQLLSTRPAALERLVVQHDESFLRQLVSLSTGRAQDRLPAAVREAAGLILQTIQTVATNASRETESTAASVEGIADGLLRILIRLVPSLESDRPRQAGVRRQLHGVLRLASGSPEALARWLTGPDFWKMILEEVATPQGIQAASERIAELLRSSSALEGLAHPEPSRQAPPSSAAGLASAKRLRQLEVSVWRALLDEAIVRGQKADTAELLARAFCHESLRHWRFVLSTALARSPPDGEGLWGRVSDIVQTLAELARGPITEQGKPASPDGTGGSESRSVRDDQRSLLGQRRASPAREEPEPPGSEEPFRILDAGVDTPQGPPGDGGMGPQSRPARERWPPSAMEEPAPAPGGEPFYIPNAGVVILHPFLAHFFKQLGLTGEDSFEDDWSRQKAVCLLHHSATGELRAPEYQLVLPRILCGMPLKAPLDHTVVVTEEERFEGEKMLQAAIEHWGALGSTSPAGLREGFLQRPGKLEQQQSGWFLQVERRALDILLDRLPWGLGIVKLPWMSEILQVEWR